MARAYGHSSANTTGRRTRSVRGGTSRGKGSGARRLIVSTAASSSTPGAGRTPPSVIHPPTAPADDGDSAAPEAPGALASVASVASVARGAVVGSEAPTSAGSAAGGGGASASTAGDFAFEP